MVRTAHIHSESGGFEPPVLCGTHPFQGCAIDHSASFPKRYSFMIFLFFFNKKINIVMWLTCLIKSVVCLTTKPANEKLHLYLDTSIMDLKKLIAV